MTDTPKKIFVPGQAMGPTIGGAGTPPEVLKARAKAQAKAPTEPTKAAPRGEGAAKQYPWMASIRMNHGLALGSQTKFMRANGEPGFYNAQRRRIYIDEMRIFAAPATITEDGVADIEIARKVGVKFSSQNIRYVDRYMPLWNINTDRNRINQWFKFNGIFKLPTRYYLQRGSIFTMRARVDATADSRALWAFGLHGKDPINKYPYSLLKNVDFRTSAQVDPTPHPQLIVFDENRDVPLKDCEIDVIALGVPPTAGGADPRDLPNPLYYQPAGPYANMAFQFQPPEGPQWHTNDDWFPFQSLLYQPGLYVLGNAAAIYYDTTQVIHRPVAPYVLEQREEFSVEIETLEAMAYQYQQQTPETTVPIYCTLFGRQEALS